MTFQRVIVSDFGSAEVLKVIQDEISQPKANEVQVKVFASGVAPGDLFRRKNPNVHANLEPPFTVGYDISGEIVSIGSNVKDFKLGQRVIGMAIATDEYPDPKLGGYAEFVNVPKHRLVVIPESIDPEKAVALVLNYLTACYAFYKYGTPKKGERILVHGGAGGVGSAMLELGRLENLEMYATSSKSKLDVISSLGAKAIDYNEYDFVKVIQEMTNNEGIDIVMDSVSGDYTQKSYNLLRTGGRYVAYGWQKLNASGHEIFQKHAEETEQLNEINKNKKTFAYYGIELDGDENSLYKEYLTKLVDLYVDGKINPLINRMKLSEATKAHELLENTQVKGKIVLIPDELF